MKAFHRSLLLVFFGASILGACDLQPKISSIPDSIGEFISQRYPALLADPDKEPEIYNSAVTDYGVYASPELYGGDNVNDYVLYASVDDYVLTPDDSDAEIPSEKAAPEQVNLEKETPVEQTEAEPDDYLVVPKYNKIVDEKSDDVKTDSDTVVVVRGDTLYSIARKHNTTVADLAKINSLKEPYTLSIGQKLQVRAAEVKEVQVQKTPSEKKVEQTVKVSEKPVETTPVKTVVKKEEVKQSVVKTETVKPAKTTVKTATKPTDVKRVAVKEITVEKGDTLYSLSRKYEIPVNDLAVMNKLSQPFTLTVGQKLKVPKLDTVQVRSSKETTQTKKSEAVVKTEKTKKITPAEKNKKATQTTKISSNPKKELPKISARSSNKFSWPVRGKILSQYGAKNKGLFNDGINIGAAQGTAVKAAENGVVAYAGNEVKGMGNLIIMQHSDGWMTVYAHLDSMSVRRGSKVSVGQQIGKVGKTGKVDKPQLHFEIRKGTKAYNPVSYLKK